MQADTYIPPDINAQDISELLSHPAVQKLLDIADQFPDWTIAEMLTSVPYPLTYEEARRTLGRLHLSTVSRRRLMSSRVNEWKSRSAEEQQEIARIMPSDILLYVKHRFGAKGIKEQSV